MLPETRPAIQPMLPEPFRVSERSAEGHGAVVLDLAPVEGDLPAFLPGQFNMLYVPGVGEVAISICGAPNGGYRHALRVVGPVTRALAGLGIGDALGVRGPFGSPWPLVEAEGRDVLLLGGGIGLAPLKPAVERLRRERKRYGRVVVLIGGRSPSSLVFQRDIEEWCRDSGLEVHVTVDRSEEGWGGRVGLITTLLPAAGLSSESSVAFLCGPEIMMRHAAAELGRLGVPMDRVHVSMERNMKCAVGFCGHCQLGPAFVCKDGPVFPYSRLSPWLAVRGF